MQAGQPADFYPQPYPQHGGVGKDRTRKGEINGGFSHVLGLKKVEKLHTTGSVSGSNPVTRTSSEQPLLARIPV